MPSSLMPVSPQRQPVVFVVQPHVLLLDAAAPAEALRAANLMQTDVAFELHYVGPSALAATSIGLALSPIAPLPDTLPDNALLIVPGTVTHPIALPGRVNDFDATAAAIDAITAWLARTVRPSHRVACICTGALIAARAGLLDGRQCTTHHLSCDELREAAPAARVLDNRLYVEDGPILTSAGITAGLDLALHLISRLVSPACAAAVARYMVVYLRRAGADPQVSPWLEGRNHLHPAIHRVQDAIAADPAHAWTNDELAAIACTSTRHLTRLFREHAGTPPLDYIHRLRIALAHELLSQTRLDMERVAERAGFSSSRHLRRVWSKFETLPPAQARRQGQMAA